MKIDGSNSVHLNPYQKQYQKQQSVNQSKKSEDKLEISNQAKEMLKGNEVKEARQKQIQQIKHDVQTGNYKVNYQETAQKMIDFWSNKG
ncbi:negative regulator of flagellin synthesis FlgM [Salinibacillus kushneri]|uniref:Negative regulator of flagellin synthesis n=1 Tax=Salinibacillus kushneri TaxID=237682 RepID=A0A1H9YTL8_9BACI|nr:flagellar biosynthesis anti-sigma factor FlgM [Salinibacillus kushneri]SES71905.1 negative regulator of flagellin synthesis FlgM [Salinibacillus kushneri]